MSSLTIEKIMNAKRELKEIRKVSPDKVKFVQGCHNNVTAYYASLYNDEGEITEHEENEASIIRDFKCAMFEDDIMSEAEFDRIYHLLDLVSIEACLAYC